MANYIYVNVPVLAVSFINVMYVLLSLPNIGFCSTRFTRKSFCNGEETQDSKDIYTTICNFSTCFEFQLILYLMIYKFAPIQSQTNKLFNAHGQNYYAYPSYIQFLLLCNMCVTDAFLSRILSSYKLTLVAIPYNQSLFSLPKTGC